MKRMEGQAIKGGVGEVPETAKPDIVPPSQKSPKYIMVDMACPCELCLYRPGTAQNHTGWCSKYAKRPKICRKCVFDSAAIEKYM